MRRRLCSALLAVACAAAAAGPAASPAARGTASAAAVTVGDNVFRPRATTVRPGAAVTWDWRGRRRHNIVFTPRPSGTPRDCRARRAGKCSRTFRRRGSFEYVCTFHGSMAGIVRVRGD